MASAERAIERLAQICQATDVDSRLALLETTVLDMMAQLEAEALRGIRKYRLGYWTTWHLPGYPTTPTFYLMGKG